MPTRVKCLHVLVGHALAAGPGVNPIGDEALALIRDDVAPGPLHLLTPPVRNVRAAVRPEPPLLGRLRRSPAASEQKWALSASGCADVAWAVGGGRMCA